MVIKACKCGHSKEKHAWQNVKCVLCDCVAYDEHIFIELVEMDKELLKKTIQEAWCEGNKLGGLSDIFGDFLDRAADKLIALPEFQVFKPEEV